MQFERNLLKSLSGDEVVDKTFGAVMLNMHLIDSFVERGFSLTKDDLFNSSTVTQDNLREYLDKILEKFKDAGVKDLDEVRETIYRTLNESSDASGEYNRRSGNSISFTDIVRFAVNSPEINKIFHPVVKDGQFSDIEKQFKDASKAIQEFYSAHPESELYPFFASKTGINLKQATQMMSFNGLKPDVTGNVIPVVVKDNFISGMTNLENYFIDCKGTRLALITNSKYVRRSGLKEVRWTGFLNRPL